MNALFSCIYLFDYLPHIFNTSFIYLKNKLLSRDISGLANKLRLPKQWRYFFAKPEYTRADTTIMTKIEVYILPSPNILVKRFSKLYETLALYSSLKLKEINKMLSILLIYSILSHFVRRYFTIWALLICPSLLGLGKCYLNPKCYNMLHGAIISRKK